MWSGWTPSHKERMNDSTETLAQGVRPPTNRTDRDPFQRPFSLLREYRAKGNHMRALVQPPPSLHCDLCQGELRFKRIDLTGVVFEFDTEIFVCILHKVWSRAPIQGKS